MNWIQENLLSLYAAIVGTIALLLNFGRLWIMYQKSNRKLKVESSIDKSAQNRLDDLAKPKDIYSGSGNLVGPIYKVTVINSSHVSMHIHDVGLTVMTSKGKKILQALVRNGSHGFLSHLDEVGGEDLPAGSRKSYSIWLNSEPVLPNIINCYVIDQMGKKYKGKYDAGGQVLTIPEITEEPNE